MENEENGAFNEWFKKQDIKKELDSILEKNPDAIEEFFKEHWELLPFVAFAVIDMKTKSETKKEDEE